MSFSVIGLKPFSEILLSIDAVQTLVGFVQGAWLAGITDVDNFFNRNLNFDLFHNNLSLKLLGPVPFENIRDELILIF